MERVVFKQAKPIFLKDLDREMNIMAVFGCHIGPRSNSVTLQITGATFYRVLFNDSVVLYGPARTAVGHASVDELELDMSAGGDIVIEVAGYNCRTLSNVVHSSFLIAEITDGDAVLAATGTDSFVSFRDVSRVQKVMRFSYQRHFSEVYHGHRCYEPWPWEEVANDLILFKREMPLAYMVVHPVQGVAAKGIFTNREREIPELRFINKVPNGSDGFPLPQIPEMPHYEYYSMVFDGTYTAQAGEFMVAGEYTMYDFARLHTGFVMVEVEVLEDSRFFLSLEEYSDRPYVGAERLYEQHCQTIAYTLPKGRYSLESFEIYSLRHLQVTVLSGRVAVKNAGVRTYMFRPCPDAVLNSGNEKLDQIFAAAVETFRQNTVDIFMDCPMRERAGWLCDSFFTSRAEREFTGDNVVERAFLRNFSRTDTWEFLPDGLLPMCFPGDVWSVSFIPQWVMWYVVELEEALAFTTKLDKEEFRSFCYRFLGWLGGHANEEGLLEKLPGWNFVEWSKCNSWVQEVNYPTNFLYSAVLKAVGRIYGDAELTEQGERVRKNTIARSFDGTLFTDNAVRDAQGVLCNTGNTSEACQYYAIHFGEIDLDAPQYGVLKHAFTEIFGRDHAGYATLGREVEPSTMFIGNYVRFLALLDHHLYDTVIENVQFFFGHMAEHTGTLWEHGDKEIGSLDHGFASFAGVALKRALEGKQ